MIFLGKVRKVIKINEEIYEKKMKTIWGKVRKVREKIRKAMRKLGKILGNMRKVMKKRGKLYE